MAHIAKGYLRIADAKYHYFQNSGGMVLSGTYISDTPINVMSKIESDPIVAGDPELSRLAHKKKIAALHTLYVKYMRAGDRRNAVRIAHMMRELVSKHGFPRYGSEARNTAKNLHKRQPDAAKILRPIFI